MARRATTLHYARAMDFTWTPDQIELREQARKVATRGGRSLRAAQRFSWINGYSKEFAKEMAALGWIGMTWPKEFGGGGRPPIERLIVGEETDQSRCTDRRVVVRRPTDGSVADRLRAARSAGRVPARILSGETTWCIGMSEPDAGSDLAVAEDISRARRRRLGDQRPEDLDQLRRGRRLLLPDLPHLDRGSATRRHQRDHRADGHPRHRDPPDQGHDHQPPLLRGVLHRRACAGRTTSSASRARRSSRR